MIVQSSLLRRSMIAMAGDLRLLRDNCSGVSAVEFALLGPVFISLIVAIMELGLFFGDRAIIDHAVQRGARVARIGYVDGVRTNQALFQQALCGGLVLIRCTDISYSVKAYSHLPSSTLDTTLDEDGNLADVSFNLGGPSDTVVVTAVYTHRFVSPFGARLLVSDGSGSTVPIIAHVVIKNEPFPLP
ncbi:MAG: pilus assembly protein [Geminicoccaceae bacterium]